jgi:N-methylhydantoinase B
MAASVDLVTVGLVQELLIATVREMRATMIKTAHSSVIYEGHDFSCAVLDGNGELVAQSEDSPAHIFPLTWQTREAVDHYGDSLYAGDVVFVNDPFTSGTHMNDVAMITPIFVGETRVAFAVVRGHWADIGGMAPGSVSGRATEIFQEGLRIPLVKVYEKGRRMQDILELIFANVRVPDESRGDFDAMLSCCHVARDRMLEVIERFGLEIVLASIHTILERDERRMREAISALAPGTYYYEDYFDSDALSGKAVLLRLAVTVEDDQLLFDFDGSSKQVQGPINCSLASTATATFTALKALLDPKSPISGGSFRPVGVVSPQGTITNAAWPAACGGFGEMRRRIESVTMGALAGVAPTYIAGDTKGTSNHVMIGSVHPGRGRTTVFYEWPAGGTGGFLENDGSHAMRAYDEGDFGSIMPAEAVELEHALLVERCELRQDSCGDGRHRGGLGLRREVRLLAPDGRLSVLSDRNVVPPFGVCGGGAAAPNRFRVRRGTAEFEPSELPGKVSGFALVQDDVVIMETAGGGGYGLPEERDLDAIAADLKAGYISKRQAQERYAVVFRDDAIDAAATQTQRRERALMRNMLRVEAVDEDSFSEGRRIFRLHPKVCHELGIDTGAGRETLVELVNLRGAPLRGWVVSTDDVNENCIRAGPIAQRILRVSAGDSVALCVLDR